MADEAAKTEDKKVEVPAKFKGLVEDIEKMSVLELSELVKVLEDKFGVSAAAPMAMMAMPGAGGASGAAPAEEKSAFNVEITEAGGQKIAVIKAVREVAGLGLKDAKDLVDKAPAVVKENVPKVEAEEMKKKIEAAGAKVTLK
ncbi:MAG: 50S ribosomal protein L7/L12 [Patescibacteria group bacterium]